MTSRTFQMILVIMSSLATISATDIFLPSLPSMSLYFKTTENLIQLTIPLYLLGSLIAAPILGTLSDHFGRRLIILWGMGLFLLGTAACFYASTLPFLLTARFVQGMGAIVSPVVGWALLQDLYPKDESAKIMSVAGSVISLAPLIAPGLGGYIQTFFGWKFNFLLIFLFASLVFIFLFLSTRKTTPPSKKKDLSIITAFNSYINILKDKQFLCYISLFSFLTAGEWCYITIIPFYFENSLHIPPNIFGLYLSANGVFYILGAVLTPIILKYLINYKTIFLAILLNILGSGGLLCVAFFIPKSSFLIVFSVGLYFLGSAILWGPSLSKALQRFENDRGSASAVRSLVLTAFCSVGGFAGAVLDDLSLFPLALFLALTSAGCFFVFQRIDSAI